MLKRVNDDMKNVEDIRTRANNYMKLDTPYEGETRGSSLTWKCYETAVGFDKVKEKVVNPFKGKENRLPTMAVCFSAPERSCQFDDPENPKIMEDLDSRVRR